MNKLTNFQLLQAFFAAILILTLLLHTLLSGIPFSNLLHFLSHNLAVSLSCAWCLSISIIYYLCTRPRPVLMLDYTCFKPEFDRKVSLESGEYFVRRSGRFTSESVDFMLSIFQKSGLGEETYLPPFIFQTGYDAKLQSAIEEAMEGIFSCVDSLLSKTQIDPQLIDTVIVFSSMFAPAPSLTSLVVNHYKLRPDVRTFNLSGMGCASGALSMDTAARIVNSSRRITYALVVVIESISLSWYFGDDRSMLISNSIFRVGCAAAMITNDPRRRKDAKMELVKSLRTHHGADDSAYTAAFQKEDELGNLGMSLKKDLVRVAGLALRDHIRSLAPRVLPVSQLVAYGYSVIMSVLSGGAMKPMVPDFKTAFDHFCIHTGGRAVIKQVAEVLRLSDELTEPARMCLHRFGNTSGTLVFYELAYFDAKQRLKKGDKLWMLAFGTGFKVCSVVWKSLRDSCEEAENPWTDCSHRYPLVNW
ncbi:PREDICTED: 3-ketoacyl-CoA synthase 1-like [Nelumbo nucifera]|uniref:3-ketoacyl-CoA synthase n=2 Tax=Nelumbo nucifera TaxID=4432 RepID=A0A1U7Z464_NELNU|nr:PREDICTED: 3-ketoacyl-CoA synthase 1-like [Nelumbo nucifera]DAD23975.1 TPA_asm: hypothetical protein HUJ06_025438 [Nelumbo nucifera]